MVRTFNLINEKGQIFSLMDINNYCLLTNPDGLGCSYFTEYSQINNNFIKNTKKIEQTEISGQLNFKNYDNYTKLINFIFTSQNLKFQYKIPKENNVTTYLKDVEFKSISKTEIKRNGFLSETIVLEALSLWYEENAVTYSVSENSESEIRWDFTWDADFPDYETRNLIFENDSHIESPFVLEVNGFVIHPKLTIMKGNEIINSIEIPTTLEEGEKLVYSTKDADLSIYKIDAHNNIINLFNDLDLNNTNFFKIPKGVSTIILNSDETEILDAKLIIYKQFIAV